MTKSLFETLQALHDSKINISLDLDWDGQYPGIWSAMDIPVITNHGVQRVAKDFRSPFTEQEIVAWLDKTARELYPGSGYSKSRLAEAAYEEVTAFDKE